MIFDGDVVAAVFGVLIVLFAIAAVAINEGEHRDR